MKGAFLLLNHCQTILSSIFLFFCLTTNKSITRRGFRRKLIKEVKAGDFIGANPIIIGEAYIAGIQQFVAHPKDPVKYGFTV